MGTSYVFCGVILTLSPLKLLVIVSRVHTAIDTAHTPQVHSTSRDVYVSKSQYIAVGIVVL